MATGIPSTGSLDLRRLRTLSQVARRSSFSQAAMDLHFTQSAVSQQVATLERDVGVQLVHRSPVALTDAGRALCRRYEAALAELAAAQIELESFREGREGRVRIAAPAFATSKLLPLATAAFAGAFGDTALSIRPGSRAEGIVALRSGDVDIAISYEYDSDPEDASQIRRLRLLQDQLTLAVPESHPLAARDSVQLAELQGLRWIHAAGEDIPRETVGTALAGTPFDPYVIVHGGTLEAVQALVAAGLGVALVHELDGREDLAVRHVPIADPHSGRSVYAGVLASHPADSPVAAMLDALVVAGRRLGREAAARHLRAAAPIANLAAR